MEVSRCGGEDALMPAFRKVSPVEIAARDQPPIGARAEIAREYDTYLASFAAGDYGRAELFNGERRALVRQRLQAAARRRGLALRFRSGPGPLTFHVAAAPAISATPPQKIVAATPLIVPKYRCTTATIAITPPTRNRHRTLS